jgi:hypothetical protein
MFALAHVRRLDPEIPLPPDWRRPDPEFLDPIYVTEALSYHPEALLPGEHPVRFVPIAEARAMVVPLLQKLLDRAVRVRRRRAVGPEGRGAVHGR